MPQERWTAMDGEVDYHRLWRAYRLRWWSAFLLVVSWTPVAGWLFYSSRHSWHQPLMCLTVIILWFVAAVASVWWQGEFRCPRCRRRYGALGTRKGRTNYTRGFYDRICANCKLRKFEHS